MSIHIPTPQELGFPEKFQEWREPQLEALRRMLTSVKRFKAVCAPTGFGKTAVYVAYALITKLATCFVTQSRALQDQLMSDFACVGMVDLRGRQNYDCLMRDDYTCQEGYAARCPHKGTMSCPSSQAEVRASLSLLVCTNYPKWTSSKKFGTGMDHFKQVVFDEGHESPHALANAMQVTLHAKEIEDTLAMDFPADRDEFVDWKPWAAVARAEAESEMQSAREQLKTNKAPALVKHMLHMRNLSRRLAILSTANPQNWIADEVERGYQFDPIHPGLYAESALLLRVPSVLVVSATLRPKTLYMVGAAKAHTDFMEFDSDFDMARCPIYYIPTIRVDSRADSLARLWILLDQIAGRRTDRKGIVHTISYSRQQEVIQTSRFRNQMLINPKGEAAGDIIRYFKESDPGTILVSPSVGAGFDFPGSECEWQFLCKIPFPVGQSKIYKARQDADPEYGAFIAANLMQQAFGRGMRYKDDQCENFIGDDHLEWFKPKFKHLFTRSFHRFYRTIRTLPAPPPRLGA